MTHEPSIVGPINCSVFHFKSCAKCSLPTDSLGGRWWGLLRIQYPNWYTQRRITGQIGSSTSWKVTAMTAGILLHRNTHAQKIESSVFSPVSGVKPQKIPMATPP